MICSKISPLAPGMAPELHSDAWRGQGKISNNWLPFLTISPLWNLFYNQSHSGDGPRASPNCLGGQISQSLALLMSGSPIGTVMAPEIHPDIWVGALQMNNYTMQHINNASMKYALKSVPGLADFLTCNFKATSGHIWKASHPIARHIW